MSTPPIPIAFQPIFKPKPWGGRRLATLLDKHLPPDEPIGESWELVSLPGAESRVRGGPLNLTPLSTLIQQWGRDLLGDAELIGGRFPLLIKFLDARENLSVQVHPKPAPDDPAGRRPGVKHEAWYVLHADPGARLYIGLKPSVRPADVVRAANTPELVDLLRVWEARPGECYYLPSGTPHALGAGIVVAEIQTPSDVTYRLYDWGRVGLDGRPRELHVAQALENMRYDVPDDVIRPPARPQPQSKLQESTLVRCPSFTLEHLRTPGADPEYTPAPEMAIWIILAGRGRLAQGILSCSFQKGDVILIPAGAPQQLPAVRLDSEPASAWLRVTMPRRGAQNSD